MNGYTISSNVKGMVRLNRSYGKRAAEVLVKAFWNHPPLQYYFPDETERARIAPYFFSSPVFSSVRYGEVYATTPNLEGIAVWLPSNSAPGIFRSFPV